MTRAKDISKIITDADFSGTLDVTGTVTAGSVAISDDNNYSFGDGTTYIQGSGAADRLKFITNASEAMRIDSSGKVGIGTSSPVYPLTVNQASIGNSYISSIANSASVAGLLMGDTAAPTNGRLSYNNNNDSMSLYTANTERMRIDSNGNVGIGNTASGFNAQADNLIVGSGSGANGITIYSGSDSYANIFFADGTSGSDPVRGGINYNHVNNSMNFRVNDAPKMYILSSGNVGIGTSSPSTLLHIKGANPEYRIEDNNETGSGNIVFRDSARETAKISVASGASANMQFQTLGSERMRIDANGEVTIQGDAKKLIFGASADSDMAHYADGQFAFRNTDAQGFVFYTGAGPTERMRIDSSGNVFVGKSSVNENTVGFQIHNSGQTVTITRSGGEIMSLNRQGSDGTIIRFSNDGATVGSIGVSGANLNIGNGDAGLQFNGGADTIRPWNITSNAARDNAIDLGDPFDRFDDIYATNGTIQTSDRNEKQDIEELSEAEQRVAVVAKGLMRKFRWKDSVAEKGDNARTHFGIIAQDLQDAFTAEGLDANDYAMFCSNTWTDDDGNEQTRLGVRYNQLLAFIISAI